MRHFFVDGRACHPRRERRNFGCPTSIGRCTLGCTSFDARCPPYLPIQLGIAHFHSRNCFRSNTPRTCLATTKIPCVNQLLQSLRYPKIMLRYCRCILVMMYRVLYIICFSYISILQNSNNSPNISTILPTRRYRKTGGFWPN